MKYEHRGKLVTFEGCEGVGKSTQIRLLEQYLTERGVPCLFTREPGGTAMGERIRTLLKDDDSEMFDETELLLFEAARFENTARVIVPALEAGKIVIVDRYIDSTTAYQAFGRGLDRAQVDALNRFGSGGVKIDLTLFLDARPFANTSRGANDRMERAGDAFHERVYLGYKTIEREEARFVAVPTQRDKDATAAEIVRILSARGVLA